MSRAFTIVGLALSLFACTVAATATATELLVRTASADITPPEPVALHGQFELRISQSVETPLTVNVVAMESRDGDRSTDAAAMVSCGLVVIPSDILDLVRGEVHKRLPELDVKKIIIHATHTHTAPVIMDDTYTIPKTGVMQVDAYRTLLVKQVVHAIEQAWQRRSPGSLTWGLSHAVVAYNRRAVYSNGLAVMYGRTDVPEFRGIEAYEEHDVNTLFF